MSTDPLRFVRADFDQLEAYTPVKPLDVLAREIGLPVDRLVKLDANENLYGPVPQIIEAIAKTDFHIYPDPGQTALREAIAGYTGLRPEQVVGGSGADDLIDILIRLVRPEAIVTASPTFGMYGFLAKIDGARVVEVPRDAEFRPDFDGIASAVAAGARMVFLASPNNPTGNVLGNAEIEALCGIEALIIVDEAYAEFSATTAIPLLERFSNLVILRTFSKWAGLAGLRVGYSLSHAALAEKMMAIKQPYNVSVAADAAARAAIANKGTIFETVKCLVGERKRMVTALASMDWLKPYPSQSNFVLFQVERGCAKDVAAALRRRGVLVRYYDRPDLANCIRISAGRPADTDRLVEALRAVEKE